MDIGERIQYFRKEISKMTQAEFSKKINMSRSNLANIEKGAVFGSGLDIEIGDYSGIGITTYYKGSK